MYLAIVDYGPEFGPVVCVVDNNHLTSFMGDISARMGRKWFKDDGGIFCLSLRYGELVLLPVQVNSPDEAVLNSHFRVED